MSTASNSPPLDTLSPLQIRSLVNAMASFPPNMRDRGREYAVRARVGRLLFMEDAVGARVRGSQVYDVWWTWEQDAWDCTCTCPIGFDCKHQYAVACCILEPLRGRGADADRRLGRLLPNRPVTWASVGPPDPYDRPDRHGDSFTGEDAAFDDDTEAEGASPEWPRPMTFPSHSRDASRPGSLAAMRAARDAWTRLEALQRLLAENPRVTEGIHGGALMPLLSERDFDITCWRVAQFIAQATAGWLPPALEPYRDRDELKQRYLTSLRATLASRLSGWADQRSNSPDRSVRFVLGLVPGDGGRPRLTLEGRMTSPRLVDVARNPYQLRALLGEAERNPRALPDDQVALLDAYLSTVSDWDHASPRGGRDVTTSTLKRMLEVSDGGHSLVWDDRLDPELATRLEIVPGDSARFARDAMSLVPACEPRDGAMTLGLHARWTDGRSRTLDRVLLLRGGYEGGRKHPSLIVADGEFHRVAELPPPELVDLFEATGGLELDLDTHSRLIDALATRFPTVRQSLAPYTRVWQARPIVAIDLREDSWMQIRAFAVSAEAAWKPVETVPAGARALEFAPGAGWIDLDAESRRTEFESTPAPAPPATAESGEAPAATVEPPAPGAETAAVESPAAAPKEVWLERMSDESIAPMIDWLRSTGADDGTRGSLGGHATGPKERSVGWWIRLGSKRFGAFAEVWDQRPDGVQWYCTPTARRMLGDVRQIRSRVTIKSAGVDWFSVSAVWEAEGLALTDEDLATLRNASGRYVKISTGWVRREAGEAIERVSDQLADLGIEPGAHEQRVSTWQLAQARPESLEAFEEMGADTSVLATIRKLRGEIDSFRGLPHARVPSGFTGTLRPYQQQGVDFLAYVSTLGLGAVLADDMGLGKTVQALAWLLWLKARDPKLGPALVVCPASVVHNWAREAETFAPGLKIALLTSGGERRAIMRERAKHDLLVTNYALMRRDIEAWRDVPLGALVLDEAQNVKNPDAAVSRAALRLDARHRLALTGTPLENRALDLWSIMACVNPGLLGSRSAFSARFESADAPPHSRRLLAARLRPVLLRRLKKDVAEDLPERIEERRDCDLHPGQRRLYLAELARSRALLDEMAPGPQDFAKRRIEVLAALTRLRQICCHPALTGHVAAGGSGKFDALWEILEPLMAEGQKVLVFSQFVRCLNLLKTEMTERGIPHHMLTGQTRKREEVVDGFQNDARPGVFLISLKAGGTGLNLTAASYVVLFDPWWNPAVEAQAIDRTHRIGQTRTVIAYRMLAAGTIEEKIWELQQKKAALARDVLGEDGFARALTRDDLEYLFAAP